MFKVFKRSQLFNRADSGGVQIYHLKAREESFLMHTLSSPNSPWLKSYDRLKNEITLFLPKCYLYFFTPNICYVTFRNLNSIFGRPYLEYAFKSPRQPYIHSIAHRMGFQMHIITAAHSPRCNSYSAPKIGGQNNNVVKIKLLFSKVIFIFFLILFVPIH